MNRILIAIMSIAIFTSCGTSKRTDSASLEANTWKLVSMDQKTNNAFSNEDSFTINFVSSDSTINGVGACNRFFGKYELKDDNNISINPGGSTMMACPNIQLEQPYFAMLQEATRYR